MHAIILAGGKGSRLQPWHAPKCLLPINGVTILQRLLTHLFDSKHVDKVIICTGYRGDDVRRSVWAHGWDTDKIMFDDVGEIASMGERLKHVREGLLHGHEQVMICYGDELADVDIGQLLTRHYQHDTRTKNHPLVTFAVTKATMPGGVLSYNNHITENHWLWMNIGFVVIEAEAWESLQPTDGVSDWINRVAEKKGWLQVQVHEHNGKRATVNSLADLAYAEEVWK